MDCGLLALATALNYLDRQTFPAAVIEIGKEIPITPQQFARLNTLYLLAYALMYTGGGRIMDWLGTRLRMPAALLIAASPLSLAMVFFSLAFFAHQFWSANTHGLEKLVRRQIHFSAALRKLVDRDATDGRYEWSDKWRLAEPNAVGGLIARESTDGKWACGIAWEDFLSAQGHNPWQCMHLSVCVGPLKRGQSKSIRGKIYLLQGGKDEVLRRYRDDFGRATRAGKAAGRGID